MKSLLVAGALALLSAGVASAATTAPAQTATTPSYAAPVIADSNAMKAADAMNHTSLRQQLNDQLTKAGYTSIKIMPSSFYIQAKDKKGEPVAMVIGPDSFAEVTELPNGMAASHQPEKPQASMQPKTAPQK
jgi:hypothetical protein